MFGSPADDHDVFRAVRAQRLRKAELMFLRDLKGMDDIGQGMLAPGAATTRQMQKDRVTAVRLNIKGLVRTEPPPDEDGPWACIYYLTTKGLRTLQRNGLTGDSER